MNIGKAVVGGGLCDWDWKDGGEGMGGGGGAEGLGEGGGMGEAMVALRVEKNGLADCKEVLAGMAFF